MPPESTVFFIGCDWGSTSFRLRLVERGTRRISEEVSEPAGVKTFATLSAAERAERMARLLGERVAAWPKAPLIVTGMASANVGWHELPYATAPFPLDGAGVRTARLPFPAAHGATRSALLVSGVCTEDDVMRGEECALIGACVLRPELARRDGLCLLAGTHPKHARLRDGALVSFATLLTGELFDVLSRASLLAGSVESAPSADEAEPAWGDFRAGAAAARTRGLAAALFQVRSRHLLRQTTRRANGWFLSGVLVGAELERIETGSALLLIGEPLRLELYREALRELGKIGPAEEPDSMPLADCVVAGQEAILQRHGGFASP